jgi:hypothetical protein
VWQMILGFVNFGEFIQEFQNGIRRWNGIHR